MAKYFYKKDKRVKRLGEDDQVQIDEYKSRGYVQVDDRRAPKPIEKPKPKPKAKPKKKVIKKVKK